MSNDASIFPVEEYKKNFVKNKTKGVKKEEKIQLAVCAYISARYPDVIFTCDLASGLKLPIWLGALHKRMRSSRGLPDLFISHSNKVWEDFNGHSHLKTKYCGLFIELKKDDARLKSGGITSTPHHKEQAEILSRLEAQGYKAVFACGFSEAKEIIDNYLL